MTTINHQSGTVYIWYPHGTQVGHAAMHIGQHREQNDNQWYVSWWPAGDDIMKTANKPETHLGDIDGEGGPPHVIYQIFGGNVTDMKTAWDAIRNKPGAHYDFLRKSCATIVARVMRAGGHASQISLAKQAWFTKRMIWKPKSVAAWCDKLRDKNLAIKTKDAGCPTKGDAGKMMRFLGLR